MKWTFPTLALILALAAALVSGCSDENQPQLDSDINVVLVLPLTGSFQARGEVHKAAVQMAFRDLTADDELLPGRELRIWLVDATSDAEEAERRVRAFIDERLTDAAGNAYVAGIISSSEPAQAGSLPVAIELEVPHFEVSSGVRWDAFIDAADERAHALAFTTQASAQTEAAFVADYVDTRDVWERMVIMRGDSSIDRLHTATIRSRLSQLGWSGRVLNDQDIVMKYGTPWRDYLAMLSSFSPAPSVVYFRVSGDTNVQDFLSDAKLVDFFPDLVSSGVTLDEELLDPVNPGIVDFLAGKFSFAARSPVSSELGNQYIDEFRRDFETFLSENPLVQDYELWAPAAYDAAMLLGMGIVAADGTDGYAVAAACQAVSRDGQVVGYGQTAEALRLLREGRDIDYYGASGPLDIRDDAIDGSTRDTAHAVPSELRVYEIDYASGDASGQYGSLSDPDPAVR
ncbi:ABC transporter substrate-binding protein [Haliangium ochraceum]|uniref:Extracellular ligand-binding receptor n=1 Tax=Haliangium ochraceum (strain DSM 14365 / JCM 11303 / SMP-2) TaxID=502025 RepID=D0LLT4_HALO1|nr:ABC transporter substrate-binding protein [Haliangium ochraceum]ACY15112.1 Extracellular ligand-binding receptor [Haliangium ochraceum DSM 14365]